MVHSPAVAVRDERLGPQEDIVSKWRRGKPSTNCSKPPTPPILSQEKTHHPLPPPPPPGNHPCHPLAVPPVCQRRRKSNRYLWRYVVVSEGTSSASDCGNKAVTSAENVPLTAAWGRCSYRG
ncbi:hypothetical protein J6590_098135 [Homalodisca vitripennis]|nr:hypothetical protein J6590_098135 [Homalodisca vitripennis]